MSRLELPTPSKAQLVVEGLYKDLERRIEASPPGLCSGFNGTHCPFDYGDRRLCDRIRGGQNGL